ncbi:MAG: DUF624 domain-containing protein [Ruminococcaceae bacterium]|nr:DUF624 domain-containing protein [Oscillospiraceae bacterium]
MAFKDFMNYQTPGKGVVKEDEETKKQYSFTKFFVLFFRKFWKIVSANLCYLFVNLPVFAGLLAISGNFNIPFMTPARQFYPILYGVSRFDMNPAIMAMMGVNGQYVESGYPSAVTYVLYGIFALTILTMGLGNTGMAYVMRNFAREDHADGAEFFGTIKRNWKQGLIMGVIDAVCIAVLIYDVTYFYYLAFYYMPEDQAFGWMLIFFAMVLIAFIYAMMRLYVNIIMVTFDLKITKILKNAFILSLLGLKRNVVALIGIAATIFLNYLIYIYFTPIGICLPFILTIGMTAFMAAYAAYPVIKRYMIDPYYPDGDKPARSDAEPIFTDRG